MTFSKRLAQSRRDTRLQGLRQKWGRLMVERDLFVSVPHGPYSQPERQRFIESPEVQALQPGESLSAKITGGNGVGYPGYYEETVVAIRY